MFGAGAGASQVVGCLWQRTGSPGNPFMITPSMSIHIPGPLNGTCLFTFIHLDNLYCKSVGKCTIHWVFGYLLNDRITCTCSLSPDVFGISGGQTWDQPLLSPSIIQLSCVSSQPFDGRDMRWIWYILRRLFGAQLTEFIQYRQWWTLKRNSYTPWIWHGYTSWWFVKGTVTPLHYDYLAICWAVIINLRNAPVLAWYFHTCWFILSILYQFERRIIVFFKQVCMCVSIPWPCLTFDHYLKKTSSQAPRATGPSHRTLDLQRPALSQIYMAECSSKSDEYGRDDGGNTYPSLHAMLVCTNLSLFLVVVFWCSGDLVEYGWIVGRHLFFGWGEGLETQ